MPDFCSLAAILIVERLDVSDADPDPRTGISLIALAQEDAAAVARNRGDVPRILPIDFESEHVHIIVDAGFEVLDPKDRDRAFKRRSGSALSL